MEEARVSLQLQWQDRPEGAAAQYRLFRELLERRRRVRARTDRPAVPLPAGLPGEDAVALRTGAAAR